jgi:hypothetical protein
VGKGCVQNGKATDLAYLQQISNLIESANGSERVDNARCGAVSVCLFWF